MSAECRPVPANLPAEACKRCDRCLMNAEVPTGAGWSNCGRSGKG